MDTFVWRSRNVLAKIVYIVETFGIRGLCRTAVRKMKESVRPNRSAPPPARGQVSLFAVPPAGERKRITVVLNTLDAATPMTPLREAVAFCQANDRQLRIVTREAPARTDLFGAFIKAHYPDFKKNVDFTFVDRANPYAELPVSDDDLFWPTELARAFVSANLILDTVHVSE